MLVGGPAVLLLQPLAMSFQSDNVFRRVPSVLHRGVLIPSSDAGLFLRLQVRCIERGGCESLGGVLVTFQAGLLFRLLGPDLPSCLLRLLRMNLLQSL